MVKKILQIVYFLILLVCVVIGFENPELKADESSDNEISDMERINYVETGYLDLKEQITDKINSGDKSAGQFETQIGIVSHHLPTALPLIKNFYAALLHDHEREVFFIIGPDHFERCPSAISLTDRDYLSPFGVINTDQNIIKNFADRGFLINNTCFDHEHSITVQAALIKAYFPHAKIVPILLSAETTDLQLAFLEQELINYKTATFIISVDFSHYHTLETARNMDQHSAAMLTEMKKPYFKLDNVDSPPAVKLAITLAQAFGYQKAEILEVKNSFDYTGKAENTTGYISAIFR